MKTAYYVPKLQKKIQLLRIFHVNNVKKSKKTSVLLFSLILLLTFLIFFCIFAKKRNMENRVRTTISLPAYLLGSLKEEAKLKKKSVSQIIEEMLEFAATLVPNKETMAAIEEARHGDNLEELSSYDIEHFEDFVAGL